LVIANPPWKFDSEIRDALEEVRAALSGRADSTVEWLVGE
jgi:23S rRNA A2030 N6-methylase RlmJ